MAFSDYSLAFSNFLAHCLSLSISLCHSLTHSLILLFGCHARILPRLLCQRFLTQSPRNAFQFRFFFQFCGLPDLRHYPPEFSLYVSFFFLLLVFEFAVTCFSWFGIFTVQVLSVGYNDVDAWILAEGRAFCVRSNYDLSLWKTEALVLKALVFPSVWDW